MTLQGQLRLAGWIAMVDLLLCCIAVLINQVNPKAEASGVKLDAEYTISAEWNVKIDADVDLHVIVPDGAKGTDVYYGSRQFHNVTLDQDNKGFVDAVTHLPDGTDVWAMADKEMTTIRGKIPGHFDVGVHLFSMRIDGNPLPHGQDADVKVRVRVVKLNPESRVMFDGNVTLHRVAQCANVVSFDLDRTGDYRAADLPLDPVCNHVFKAVAPP